MNPQKYTGYVRQQTLFMAVAISLVLGFLGGVTFTAYKTSAVGTPHQGKPAPAQSGVRQMAEALEKETARHPDNADAWIRLGHIYFDNHNYDKAIRAYEKAIALVPDNANVLTDLGVMYRRSGQPEKAVETFDRAIGADPRHETARFNKGIVLMHDLKERERAITVWQELLKINPVFMAPDGQSLDELVQHYTEHEAPQAAP